MNNVGMKSTGWYLKKKTANKFVYKKWIFNAKFKKKYIYRNVFNMS